MGLRIEGITVCYAFYKLSNSKLPSGKNVFSTFFYLFNVIFNHLKNYPAIFLEKLSETGKNFTFPEDIIVFEKAVGDNIG